jgi:hypothetical protein
MAKDREEAWAEAKQRCSLDEATLEMAREMGLNPRSLIKNVPGKSQPWKAPVREWIRDMYERRHRRGVENHRANEPERNPAVHTHDRRQNEDDHFRRLRCAHFRAAAEYVALALADVPAVSRVALFGSVASRRRARTLSHVRVHEPKDVDLAVWIDSATDLERLRVLRSRAVNQLWNDREIGVAHHQVDVFLIDVTTGTYLGRLCCFNQCPKHKPECRTENCGKLPFLQQHDDFVFDFNALHPSQIEVLYDRDGAHVAASLDIPL